MSAVTVSDGAGDFVADFTPSADEMFERARMAGMHIVRSSVPMESWPRLSGVARAAAGGSSPGSSSAVIPA